VGNESEIAKLLKNKDGGKNAMRLASTLLSVMSETSEEELKTEDKMKVKLKDFCNEQLFTESIVCHCSQLLEKP